MQSVNKGLSDVGGRGIAEGLKGNSSVTEVDVVSLGGLLLWLFVLTCTEQNGTSIGDAVKREILELVEFNKDNPAQKLKELCAIKEVTPSLPARWRSKLQDDDGDGGGDDDDDDDDDDYR